MDQSEAIRNNRQDIQKLTERFNVLTNKVGIIESATSGVPEMHKQLLILNTSVISFMDEQKEYKKTREKKETEAAVIANDSAHHKQNLWPVWLMIGIVGLDKIYAFISGLPE